MTPLHVQKVLDRLPGVKKSGKGWIAYCPVHENDGGRHQRSLSISIGADGRILLHCHAGCSTEDILKAVGLEMKDLYPPKEGRQVNSNGKIVATYDYVDANAIPVFQVVRYEGKKFLQRRPGPWPTGRWTWNLDGVERVLYNLPALLAADPDEVVFVAEGEKDVDALSAIGLTATCNSGGAMKWGNVSDDTALKGRRVVIIADKDDAGRRHAQDVAIRLAGRASEIKIIEMPGDDNKDATDWLDSLDDKEPGDLADAFRDMAEQAPVWRPDANAPEVENAQLHDSPVSVEKE